LFGGIREKIRVCIEIRSGFWKGSEMGRRVEVI
jgi:hypothetical protein